MRVSLRMVSKSASAALLVWLTASSANASKNFPGALEAIAGMPCVPGCVLCHGEVEGHANTFQKRALPRALVAEMQPGLAPESTTWLKAAYDSYAAKAATDPNIQAVVHDLQNGIDPETKESLCGPIYGCAIPVPKLAKASSDYTGVLWVLGAVLTGGLLRRHKQAR